jgi:hypothetical protein
MTQPPGTALSSRLVNDMCPAAAAAAAASRSSLLDSLQVRDTREEGTQILAQVEKQIKVRCRCCALEGGLA